MDNMNIGAKARQKHYALPLDAAKVLGFIKKNTVVIIAFVAAAVTSIIVPVDSEYLDYFDYKTLTCLFCGFSHLYLYNFIFFRLI